MVVTPPPILCLVARFNRNVNSTCCLYNLMLETSLHIFWECSLARALWFDSEWGIRTDFFPLANLLDLIAFLLSLPAGLGLDSGAFDRFLLRGQSFWIKFGTWGIESCTKTIVGKWISLAGRLKIELKSIGVVAKLLEPKIALHQHPPGMPNDKVLLR